MSNTTQLTLPDGSRILHHEVLDNQVKGVRELRGRSFRFTTTRTNWDRLLHLDYANSDEGPALSLVRE